MYFKLLYSLQRMSKSTIKYTHKHRRVFQLKRLEIIN